MARAQRSGPAPPPDQTGRIDRMECPECGTQYAVDPGGGHAVAVKKVAYGCENCGYRGSFYEMVEDRQDNPVGSH